MSKDTKIDRKNLSAFEIHHLFFDSDKQSDMHLCVTEKEDNHVNSLNGTTFLRLIALLEILFWSVK